MSGHSRGAEDGAGTGSRELSAHLLLEPARGAIVYYDWCEKQLLSIWRHIVLFLHYIRFLHQVCMFGFGLYSRGIFIFSFPSSLFLIRRGYPSSQITFQKTETWKEHPTSSNSVLSPICHITLQRLHPQACRARFNHEASFSSQTPT